MQNINNPENAHIGASQGRRNSLGSHIQKTDILYRKKDPKKIKMDEFVVDVNFKFGVPLLMLDIINSLTGFDILGQIK